jgi:hypothetical protein
MSTFWQDMLLFCDIPRETVIPREQLFCGIAFRFAQLSIKSQVLGTLSI